MTDQAHFEAIAESVPRARSFVASVLATVPESQLGLISLMVSELATNAVLHAKSNFSVTVERMAESVTITVSDNGQGEVVRRSSSEEDVSGRGLQVVDAFSDCWGVNHPGEHQKDVWFQVALEAESACR